MTSVAEAFAYDAVPYDTEANPDAHPRSMAAAARLFGLHAAPAGLGRSRTLDLGCGDGEHLVAAASYLPDARFVGFDLAARAIAAGRAAAEASGAGRVHLVHADAREVRRRGLAAMGLGDAGTFDFVIAHGMASWVPPDVREDIFTLARAALAPEGVFFVSANALPGWELRRALRVVARRAARGAEEPRAAVEAAIAAIEAIGEVSGADGFAGVLAAAARAYVAHVRRATPPSAPFSRYVFHDLLADPNEPLSASALEATLARAGLRALCEAPLAAVRADAPFPGLAAHLETSGLPFVQVLACRDDAPARDAPDVGAVLDGVLWADLAPRGPGVWRTSTGRELRLGGAAPPVAVALGRLAARAPAFVPAREIVDSLDDGARDEVARALFAGIASGALAWLTEAPPIAPRPTDPPRIAPHVRRRAAEAAARGASATILTSALHRSYLVPFRELVVVRELDGATPTSEVIARVGRARETPTSPASPADPPALVAEVLDRLARHAFLLA